MDDADQSQLRKHWQSSAAFICLTLNSSSHVNTCTVHIDMLFSRLFRNDEHVNSRVSVSCHVNTRFKC